MSHPFGRTPATNVHEMLDNHGLVPRRGTKDCSSQPGEFYEQLHHVPNVDATHLSIRQGCIRLVGSPRQHATQPDNIAG